MDCNVEIAFAVLIAPHLRERNPKIDLRKGDYILHLRFTRFDFLGSSILGTQSTPTRVLSEWLAESGVFSEFWRPCVYLTDEGTSKFNCSLEDNVPTLLLIRKDRVLVGGYMAHKNSSKTNI